MPGRALARLGYDAVLRRDYPTIMGLTMLTASFVMVVNLVVDILYSLADPRIAYTDKERSFHDHTKHGPGRAQDSPGQ